MYREGKKCALEITSADFRDGGFGDPPCGVYGGISGVYSVYGGSQSCRLAQELTFFLRVGTCEKLWCREF